MPMAGGTPAPLYGTAWLKRWTSYSDNVIVWGMVICNVKSGREGARTAVRARGYSGVTFWSIRRHHGFGGDKTPPICFCETNPPFFEDFFDATATAEVACDRKVRRISVGSFSKTNPPGRGGLEASGPVGDIYSPRRRNGERAARPTIRGEESGAKICETAKRTGLEIDGFYAEQPEHKGVGMQGRKFSIRFVWNGIGDERQSCDESQHSKEGATATGAVALQFGEEHGDRAPWLHGDRLGVLIEFLPFMR